MATSSLITIKPSTIHDALVVSPSAIVPFEKSQIDVEGIKAQTRAWKDQQDAEDELYWDERMSQFRNCRSMIDLISSKKIPQMKLKLGVDGGGTISSKTKASVFRSVKEQAAGTTLGGTSQFSTSKTVNTAATTSSSTSAAEAAALLRGCPHTRLSYLDVDILLGSDDRYIAYDLPSVAAIVAPAVTAPEIKSSASVTQFNRTRNQTNKSVTNQTNSQTQEDTNSCGGSTINGPPVYHATAEAVANNRAKSTIKEGSSSTPGGERRGGSGRGRGRPSSSVLRERLFVQLEAARQRSHADRSEENSQSKGYVPDESMWSRQVKLSTAVELLKEVHRVVDPQRCFFHAGLLFDEVGQHERALMCFSKALAGTPPPLVVDTYQMPLTDTHHRKIRYSNKSQLTTYLAERAHAREQLIIQEERRQRLKVLISHLKLIRLRMIFGHHSETHDELCGSFDLCESHAEHLLVLQFTHALLSQMAYTPGVREIAISRQLVRESAGPLAEAHIWVLRDLLNEDVVRHDSLFEWLGRRYAETSDFVVARKYFKMARDVREGLVADVTKVVPAVREAVLTANSPAIFGLREYGEDPPISEFDRRWRGAGGGATGFDFGMQRHDFLVERYKVSVGVEMGVNERRKYPLGGHEWHSATDVVVDQQHAEERADYSKPGRAHQAAATCLYAAPTQGWGSLPDDKPTQMGKMW